MNADAPRRTPFPIRAKLVAAAAVLIAGSTVLYGSVAFRAAREALLPSIGEQLADDVINVKGGLEEMLTAHYRNVHTWARLSLMRELVVRDLDKTIARFLQSIRRDYGVYLDVLALDGDGLCVASSDAADIGRSFAGTPLGDGLPKLEWSEKHQAWYLRLASVIPDPDDPRRNLGTVVAMLDREVLDRIVVPKPGHSRLELRLLDGNGRVIAGVEDPLDLVHVSAWPAVQAARPELSSRAAIPKLREGVDARGRALLVAQAAVGDTEALPTKGWHLTASVPQDVALLPVALVRERVFHAGILLVVVGLALATLLADRLTRPIKDLTAVAVRIGSTGDLEPVPSPSSRDEVGDLAIAFQRMVSAVAIANDEMVRASKLAFLGEMAAGMAHEIRTPLGIIRNSAQLLERRMESTGDGEAGEWAMFIREESDRLGRVVSTLLDFVRPAEPAKSTTDIAAIATRSVEMLAAEAEGRGVVLRVDAADSVPIPCDPDQIRQVLLNLVLNALQATPRGGTVAVTVSADGGGAQIVVCDTGVGIPDELRNRLFEPFTSRRDGGIGLGLAIVRRIVRAHGGEVRARNREGGGAAFTVWLPGAAAPPLDAGRHAA